MEFTPLTDDELRGQLTVVELGDRPSAEKLTRALAELIALRDENARLRAALKEIVEAPDEEKTTERYSIYFADEARRIAREALEGDE